MKNLGLLVLALLLSVLLGLLGTKVILSVSNLYELTFISELGFVKVFGLFSLISLAVAKYKDSIKEEGDEMYEEVFKRIVYRVVELLSFWGLMYVVHYIIS